MRLTIAYSKIKKRNLVLINNDTHQRETLSERPIRPPLNGFVCKLYGNTYAVHVTVALVGVATLNLALPAPLLNSPK